jgi:hypothetical protein
VFPGKGVLGEQTPPGLDSVYVCGVQSLELDPMFTAGNREPRKAIAAHDFSLNRLFARITGGFHEQVFSQFRLLRIVFKLLDHNGEETGEFFESAEKPLTMQSFLDDVFFCHNDRDAFYDTRNRDAGDWIAAYSRMIAAETIASKRAMLIENIAFQVYPHGYPGGAQDLYDDVVSKGGDPNFLEWAKIVPCMTHDSMRYLTRDEDLNDPRLREEMGYAFLQGFHDMKFRVAAHAIYVWADDEWISDAFELNETKFRAVFERDPKP